MIPKIDLTGKKFGRLTVTSEWSREGRAKFIWKCLCDCGAIKFANGEMLRKGRTLSCSCLQREITTARNVAGRGVKRVQERRRDRLKRERNASRKLRWRRPTIKGWGSGYGSATHGAAGKSNKTWTPEYRAWVSMKTRCSEKYVNRREYKHYYGRGIRICERWLVSFEDFLSDVGLRPSPKHSLDRVNNDGNYEPGNIRWATRSEQVKNQRPRLRIHPRLRHEVIRRATPPWLTKEQKQEICGFYERAAALGRGWHVDHIYPLRGKNSSGLHVPWNLQIITAIKNLEKNNHLPKEEAWNN